MKKLLSLFALASAISAEAAKLSVVDVPSASMNKSVRCTVMLPDGYAPGGDARYPVVYLLHGAGADHRALTDQVWQKGVDEWGFIGVCPDGDRTSWWWDSPVDPGSKYETFVAKELVPWIDRNFQTVAKRGRRAIAGCSMGGHGACWIGFRHRDVFGAIGNIYGGVDVRPFPKNWGIAGRLGPYEANPERWREHVCVNEAAKLRNGDINLITLVGTQDFFLKVNRQMHEILLANEVEHTYVEIRGKDAEHSSHTGAFLHMVAPVVFRYFNNCFAEGRGHL